MPDSDGFAGLRVLALESRRRDDMQALISARGGEPVVVPALEERARSTTDEALAFAGHLSRDELAMVVFLTGVGVRLLARAIDGVLSGRAFADALNRTTVIARGPKPVAALREIGVASVCAVPRPHTWREVLQLVDEIAAIETIRDRRIAVQEYGVPADALVEGLKARGAFVLSVPVYEWAIPDDAGPLRAAVGSVVRGEFDVVLFTAAVQVEHLFQVADTLDLRAALARACTAACIGSIGPATTESLRRHGVSPDIEPSRSNMGLLVVDAAAGASLVLARKRAGGYRPAT